jgi:hypothetical protein
MRSCSSFSKLAFVPRTAAMPVARAAFAALTAVASLGAFLTPASAAAAPTRADAPSDGHKPGRTARITKSRPCTKTPVSIAAGSESAAVSLTKCDGTANPAGVDELSVLARPGSAPKPAESIAALEKVHGPELAPGIRRIDARLAEQLGRTALHFGKDGEPAHVVLVSGYRPRSAGSYHSSGRALDFRLDGVPNSDVIAFCKTLQDTGCGYYPNSVFVHMDVRPAGSGHVAWVDTSRPGEAPHYVSPGATAEAKTAEAKNDKPAKGSKPAAGAAATSDNEVAIGEVAAHEQAPASADDTAAEKLPPLPKASQHRPVAAAMMAPISP